MAAPPPHRIRVVCRLRPADDAAVEVRGASLIVPKNRSVRESRDELPAQGGLRFSVDAVYDQEARRKCPFLKARRRNWSTASSTASRVRY